MDPARVWELWEVLSFCLNQCYDAFDFRMGVGAALAIGGVLIVALRRKPATELLVDREQR